MLWSAGEEPFFITFATSKSNMAGQARHVSERRTERHVFLLVFSPCPRMVRLMYNLDTKDGRKAWKDAAPKGVERFVIEDGEPWARQYGERLYELALTELAT